MDRLVFFRTRSTKKKSGDFGGCIIDNILVELDKERKDLFGKTKSTGTGVSNFIMQNERFQSVFKPL